MKSTHTLFLCLASLFFTAVQAQKKPVRLAIVGLTHSHVHWILGREKKADIEVVGIVEPNKDLANRYAKQYGYPMSIVFNTIEDMIKKTKPVAVAAFGTIYEHLKVVEVCAPQKIHVMVEKPLAVSLDHARKMQQLATDNNIHLVTNYETTWYSSNHEAYKLVSEGAIGDMRKIIVRDGHKGPKKIELESTFLNWLIDSVQNGGGALTDFGCYGANLATWFHRGERPLTVTTVTQQLQKENNPNVDDDATIILTYPHSNAVIQASWNWPIGRKDLEVYGLTGALYADNNRVLRLRKAIGYDGFHEDIMTLKDPPAPYNDPFAYFAAVINKEIKIDPLDLSSLENNMIVMEILEAAKQSALLGKTIVMDTKKN